MRVTFCAYDWPRHVGGVNSWLKMLLPDLRRRGIESRVLLFTYYGPPADCPTVTSLRLQGFDCPAIGTPVYMEDRVRWLLRRTSAEPPDVFVTNNVGPAYYAGRWLRDAGIPTVGVMHSDDAGSHALVSEFLLGDERYRMSALVCVSRFQEQLLVPQSPSGTPVRRIPYGVKLPTGVASPPGEKTLRLIYAGRLDEPQKRISELTRALCLAVRAVPGTEAVIYGEGAATESVKRILATEGDGLPVQLAGRVDSEQIPTILQSGHVFVLLSDYEGLPVSLMEAMACGVVPVCLRIRSGIVELVRHDETGLLVEDRGDDFVRAVRRLRTEPGLWERLSAAARATIEDGYTNQDGASGWLELFEALQKSSGPRREIKIPRRIVLPPAHPDLAQGDLRRPFLPVLVGRGAWRFAWRTIRRLGAGHDRRPTA